MKIDLAKLQPYIDDRYISVQRHPEADLLIYNYTQKAQFDNVWTEETKMCRGLILDPEGNVIARPFKKFFNLDQHEGPLPGGDFKVYEKMDGSLGILYWLNGVPHLATRGSFTSEQAKRGTEILHRLKEYWFWLRPGYTYLFEIIYPENRIVVDYGNTEEIVLLAVVDTETGEEIDYGGTPFAFARAYDGLTDVDELRSRQEDNREGYVLKWPNGFRLKFKFEEYVRLHRLITGVNKRRIWDMLRNKQSLDELLDRVPDEFYSWVKDMVQDLEAEYQAVEDSASIVFMQVNNLPTRKEQALALQSHPHRDVVFLMIDGRPYEEVIWRKLKPAAETPFKMIDMGDM